MASEAASQRVQALLEALEQISRQRPDRVLRLIGHQPGATGVEPFELLLFRGFSSSVSHPTAHDPDEPALPPGASIDGAMLLQAPLDPSNEQVLVPLGPLDRYLEPGGWG